MQFPRPPRFAGLKCNCLVSQIPTSQGGPLAVEISWSWLEKLDNVVNAAVAALYHLVTSAPVAQLSHLLGVSAKWFPGPKQGDLTASTNGNTKFYGKIQQARHGYMTQDLSGHVFLQICSQVHRSHRQGEVDVKGGISTVDVNSEIDSIIRLGRIG